MSDRPGDEHLAGLRALLERVSEMADDTLIELERLATEVKDTVEREIERRRSMGGLSPEARHSSEYYRDFTIPDDSST